MAGNPATARLASGVGNCFPGLEMDVRNLEGRFFPGILFRVVTAPLKPVPEATSSGSSGFCVGNERDS